MCRFLNTEPCLHGDIRLRGGGAPTEGRVEVCSQGEWGTVCGNGWGLEEARTVCRQMGLNTIGTKPKIVCVL